MNFKPKTSDELSQLDSSELLMRLDELRDAAQKAGLEWVEAKKKYEDCQELLPSILATYQVAIMNDKMTMAEAKARALADDGYKQNVKAMTQAQYEAHLKEVEYKGLMKSLDVLTSISYVRNSELKTFR